MIELATVPVTDGVGALWDLAAKAPYVAAVVAVVVFFLRHLSARDKAGRERDEALRQTLEKTGQKYEEVVRDNTATMESLKGSIGLMDRSLQELRRPPSPHGG